MLNPWYEGGANRVSLEQGQKNFSNFGVSEERFRENVKGVLAEDVRHKSWRPVNDGDRKHVTTQRLWTRRCRAGSGHGIIGSADRDRNMVTPE